MENKCVQNNLTTLQLHKADRITFLNGYQATRISCTSNPAKSARKEGKREGVCVCVWKGPTVNEGNKVGKEKNRRKLFFKEDIPLCLCN
jgi:hypothetical protein